ncbi:MAG TPA: hypothetical protein VNB06_02750 [Thermoanaerobaculia bacterium]|nr:hypothetical protein [Thermoanaerobaculia bacterium]
MNGASTNYFKPSLIAGAAFGAASGIPLLNCANLACCALAIGGGFLGSYLYLKELGPVAPPPYGPAAIIGLLTGAIGAVVAAIVALPFQMMGMAMGGGFSQIQEALADQDLPAGAERLITTLATGGGFVLALLVNLVLFSIFAVIGALIGVAVLARQR